MKVTITLGPEAMEFVAGIPLEELPEILSDVLERSLREQVRPLSPAESNPVDNTTVELLNQVRELLSQSQFKNTPNIDIDNNKSSDITKEPEPIVNSIKLESNPEDELDLGEFGDLLK